MSRDNVHRFNRLDDFREFVLARVATDPTETFKLRQYFGRQDVAFPVELQMTGQASSWRPFTLVLEFERATSLYQAWKKNKHGTPIGVRSLPGIAAMLGEKPGDLKQAAEQLRVERDRVAAEARDRNVRTYLAPFARKTAEDLALRLTGLLPASREALGQPILSLIDHLNALADLTEAL